MSIVDTPPSTLNVLDQDSAQLTPTKTPNEKLPHHQNQNPLQFAQNPSLRLNNIANMQNDDNIETPYQYLFAPPYYQPHFSTTNISAFGKIGEQSPEKLISAQLCENDIPLEKKCCGLDYIDYTVIRILFSLRQAIGVVVTTILGFVWSHRYSSFYLVFPVLLMSTAFTIGMSLPSLYGNTIALMSSLVINYVLFRYYEVTPLLVGLGTPIILLVMALLWTSKVPAGQWKLFSTFLPVFLLIGWDKKQNHTFIVSLIEMCSIAMALSVAIIVIPYPLQTNHHVDGIVRDVLKKSSQVTYLLTKGFLNERYNHSHLVDYAQTNSQPKKPSRVDKNGTPKSRLDGSLFEPHLRGIKAYNEIQESKKQMKRNKRDFKISQNKKTTPAAAAAASHTRSNRVDSSKVPFNDNSDDDDDDDSEHVRVVSSPINSNSGAKLPSHHRMSHELYYNLHSHGGKSLYVESYSDGLSTSSTDDEMLIYVNGSSISGDSVLSSSSPSNDDNWDEIGIDNNDNNSNGDNPKVGVDLYGNHTGPGMGLIYPDHDVNAPFSSYSPGIPGLNNDLRYYNAVAIPSAANSTQTELNTNFHKNKALHRCQNEAPYIANPNKVKSASTIVHADKSDIVVESNNLFSSPHTQSADGQQDVNKDSLNSNVGYLKSTQPLYYTLPTDESTDDDNDDDDDDDDDSQKPLIDTPFFQDLYSHLGREYAPEHPQGSIRAREPLNSGDYIQEDPNLLHVPFPELYFHHLRELLIGIESDLDIARTLVVPLKYESMLFRLLALLTCCFCGRFKYSELAPVPISPLQPPGPTTSQNPNNDPEYKKGLFYSKPHWIYPNIFSATTFFHPPYNSESLNTFISEMLLAITNVRGMMSSLRKLPQLSKGGLMLYHFWGSFIRRDLKQLAILNKALITNIINHNQDIVAFDSAFINAVFSMSSPTILPKVKRSANKPPCAPKDAKHDIFSSLYMTLTKHKSPNGRVKLPTEKQIRNMQFVPGTAAALLHQWRNMWLQASRIRQLCFYGIRKTKYFKSKNTPTNSSPLPLTHVHAKDRTTVRLSFPGQFNVTSTSPSSSPRSSVSSTPTQTQTCRYVLKTRKVVDPIFNFHTHISQRYSQTNGKNLDQFSTPIYNNLHADFSDHTSTILNSPFSQLYAPSNTQFPLQPRQAQKPQRSSPKRSSPRRFSTKSNKKPAVKQHFQISIEDVVLFNNFFFNFDRFHTRLYTVVLPTLCPHLYPLALLTSTSPSSLTISDSINSISASSTDGELGDASNSSDDNSSENNPGNGSVSSAPAGTTVRATMLKPAHTPNYFFPSFPITKQDLIDFFIPNLVFYFWGVFNLLLCPPRVAQLPQHDISIVRSAVANEEPKGGISSKLENPNQPGQANTTRPRLYSTLADDENVVEIDIDEYNNDEEELQEISRRDDVDRSRRQDSANIALEPLFIDDDAQENGLNSSTLDHDYISKTKSIPYINPNRHFHHQIIEYAVLPVNVRFQRLWAQHIKPTPAEMRWYRFLWRNILCITVAAFIVIIPSQFKQTQYIHWPSLSTAILMNDSIGVGASIGNVLTRVVAQILGAFFSYFLVRFALKIDPDHDITTGVEGASFIIVFLALATAYFSYARTSRTKEMSAMSAASTIVSICVITLGSYGHQDTQQQVLHRLEYTLYAGVIVFLGSLLIFPNRGINGVFTMLSATFRGMLTILDFNSQMLIQTTLFQYAHGSFNSFGPTLFPIVSLKDDKIIEFDLNETEYQDVIAEVTNNPSGKGVYESLRRKIMLLDHCDDLIYKHALESTSSFKPSYPGPHKPVHDYHTLPTRPPGSSDSSTIVMVSGTPTIGHPKPPPADNQLQFGPYRPNPPQINKDLQIPSEPSFRTRLQIYHPFDSRSRFFYNCVSTFTQGTMSLESIGLKLLPYPPYPVNNISPHLPKELAIKHAQTLFEQERQYHTIRHTNYLNFLFVYNARIKQRTADLRSLGLTLTKTIPSLENESIFSIISTVKRRNICVLQSIFTTLLTLTRLIHRIHELLYCYQFTLISVNEYYNSTGDDMNSAFKSIIQLNYEGYINQQLNGASCRTGEDSSPVYENESPILQEHSLSLSRHQSKHFHDGLAFENQDLTQLLINHTHDLLARKLPKMTQTELFIHLKTKTLQVNKMLMAECLPLFLSFNQTMSYLLQSTLKTVDSLFKQTVVPTTLSMAWDITFSFPIFNTHNTVQFQRFRGERRHKDKIEEATHRLEWLRQQQSHDGVNKTNAIALKKQQAKVKKLQAEKKLFNAQEEGEFLNKPFAHGVVLKFIMFEIGPCCVRKVKDDSSVDFLPPARSSAQSDSSGNSKVGCDHTSDVEMGRLSSASELQDRHALSTTCAINSQLSAANTVEVVMDTDNTAPTTAKTNDPNHEAQQQSQQQQSQQQQTSMPIRKPVSQLKQDISYPNPHYDRSQRISLQKQYVYQLIAYLRQIKFIFQEITYQRFYGGRDGYYSPYPTQLVNLEHSFLVTIEQCPPVFMDIISLFARLDGDV